MPGVLRPIILITGNKRAMKLNQVMALALSKMLVLSKMT
ncbi:hypothetical protein YPPY66_3274 [Yersinia pestis PY-66]|uniref:Uncharacterized protein n=2 Tax=Yersinia pestis TaxID=632 RepID=A0AAV3BAM2_YERPE|nr:hypothetical protein YpAngola_A1848 [Yersinia pestis Angola]EDR32955.1 hypothetical protein YPIP275_0973 [Yersinia pestis biovar Orientalis str. IP275]EDR39942.1 hypothetical protein YpF1991016_3302 [Yersinia pestis biovar Orientalis str. F1991016]EDR44979.1 hypothetical protein YpE1979001_1616 [Yersinia pestis biovar Antiqua str. E1979001]EDR50731.1 hypothetical protein YpB42003004_0974 [Yersinia pestis biovar Antiqua str. B42003004]EDR55598.1 hypothetical protein YpMG051020_0228 [Yersinia